MKKETPYYFIFVVEEYFVKDNKGIFVSVLTSYFLSSFIVIFLHLHVFSFFTNRNQNILECAKNILWDCQK